MLFNIVIFKDMDIDYNLSSPINVFRENFLFNVEISQIGHSMLFFKYAVCLFLVMHTFVKLLFKMRNMKSRTDII